MTGRNESCPCGSGKKFKKCHGKPGQSATPLATAQVSEEVRSLMDRKQPEAALALLQAQAETAETCAMQVDILVGRNKPGDLDRAEKLVGSWKKLDPAQPEAWSRALEIQIYRREPDAVHAALTSLRKRTAGQPRTSYYQALVEHLFGEFEQARQYYVDAARGVQPTFSDPAIQVMAAMRACSTESGDHPGTRRRDERALLCKPELVEWLEDSLEHWEESVGSSTSIPQHEAQVAASGCYQLGSIKLLGFYPALQSVQCFKRALHWNPQHRLAQSNALMALNYCAESSPQGIFTEHQRAGRMLMQRYPARKRRFSNSRLADRPLRIGYLSADFRSHPVAHFILPVLENHDSSLVRTFLYHTAEKRDEITDRAMRAANQFFHAWNIDDKALAQQIERDQVDILVDLTGATANDKLSLLAARAAPVQITWLGYPNTTGIESVDYRLVDSWTDPAPGADALCTETLVRLPRLFSVFDPLNELPEISSATKNDDQAIQFGSFNNLAKINDELVSCWSKLLQRLPHSRLLLKDFAFDHEAVRQRMRDWFERYGTDPTRLDFLGTLASKADHLSSFNQVDIHLDSFPYNGTTTTCDSLLMGVPVVALAGSDHRSRVGVSLLNSAGYPQWVADDRQAYLEIAAELAADRAGLRKLKESMRDQLLASPLLNAEAFTRDLEQVYRQCWENWCRISGPLA